MSEAPYLSVVIPAYNEQENIEVLLQRVEAAMTQTGKPFEVIVVDDGSTDDTPRQLEVGLRQYPWLRVLRLRENCGQSAAFDAGFSAARGEVIATLDADLQNDPQEIQRLLPMLDGFDMITGWRKDRQDSWFRRRQTRIANRIRNWISDETIEDSASSLKLYKRHCLEGLWMYRGMHRFFPTLVKLRGYSVLETPVKHGPRHAGTAKYGLRNRAWSSFLDLLAVRWMKKRWLRYEVDEVKRTP
jgi:dolichol-phosphate mannosyltransferase